MTAIEQHWCHSRHRAKIAFDVVGPAVSPGGQSALDYIPSVPVAQHHCRKASAAGEIGNVDHVMPRYDIACARALGALGGW